MPMRALLPLIALIACMPPAAAATQLESLHIPSGIDSLRLLLRRASTAESERGPAVLILHGATFPSGNAAAWRIDGQSWMDDLAVHGYDVYALDFLGYGGSDKYPEMAVDVPSGPALGDVPGMVRQVDAAIEAIRARRPGATVHVIAHSAAGRLDTKMFSDWAAVYLSTDASSSTRSPLKRLVVLSQGGIACTWKAAARSSSRKCADSCRHPGAEGTHTVLLLLKIGCGRCRRLRCRYAAQSCPTPRRPPNS
jgi:pimeloyl-ACP methyl ester carboxylesterase